MHDPFDAFADEPMQLLHTPSSPPHDNLSMLRRRYFGLIALQS